MIQAPGKPFQNNLKVVGKPKSLSTLVRLDSTRKHCILSNRLTRDKHFSLFVWIISD
jgi:hypothetical protein